MTRRAIFAIPFAPMLNRGPEFRIFVERFSTGAGDLTHARGGRAAMAELLRRLPTLNNALDRITVYVPGAAGKRGLYVYQDATPQDVMATIRQFNWSALK